jgi:hypothetical protein
LKHAGVVTTSNHETGKPPVPDFARPAPRCAGLFFSRSVRQFHQLTLAPIRHNCSHTAAANKSRDDDNGHHRDNADHPYKIYEITRISTRMQLKLLKSGSQESSLEILR